MRPSATAARVRQQPKSGQPAGSAVAARASHRLPLLDPCCCRLSKRESPWTTVGKHTVGGGPVNPAFTCDNASRCRSAQCAKTVGGRTFSRSAACRRRHAASPPLAIVCSADRRCRSGSGHGSGDSGGRWRVEGQTARVRPRVSGRGWHDDDAACRGRHDRRVEDVCGGLAPLGGPAADDANLEVHLAAARADPHQPGLDLDDVPCPHRRPELHVGVRREQALVAVRADAHLRGDVTEGCQGVGAVDEVAGVVGVAVGHVAAVDDAEPDLGSGHERASLAVTRACTR